MQIKSAKFVTSAVKNEQFLTDFPCIAFVGRSNVGKSSLINSLCNVKNLAKASSTPGLTKMVNYFLINTDTYFVDLPGYGFSKTGKSVKDLWSDLMQDYLLNSQNLKKVVLLLDIRHPASDLDKQMISFLFYNQIPFLVVATKADKVAKTKIKAEVQKLAISLGLVGNNIIAYSSENAYGKEVLLQKLGDV